MGYPAAEERLYLRLCLGRRRYGRTRLDHRRPVAVFELHQPVHAAVAAARPARQLTERKPRYRAPAFAPGLLFLERPFAPPSCPGSSRLRGRSRFGEAKARVSTSFLRCGPTWMVGTSPAMTRIER